MQGYQQQPAYEPGIGRGTQLNTGVAQFMNGVYAWMAAGIGVTAAVAYGVGQSSAAMATFFGRGGPTLLGYAAMFAPLILVLIFSNRLMNMSRGAATAIFMVVAVCYGVMFSVLPYVFSLGSIAQALISTVGMFAAMAAFGYFTKKDLTGVGQFLLMAVFGIIIASLINVFFVQSASASIGINIIIVIVFAGLTAYDTQKIKQHYLVHGGADNLAIVGALELYLDFINIFLALLRLFGSRD